MEGLLMPHNDFTFDVYEDQARPGEWRWRLVAANGETIADSGEGYDSKWNAKRSAWRLKRARIRVPK